MKRKLMCAAGSAALVLAMLLPEAAELGGAGVTVGSLLSLALMALAWKLLRTAGIIRIGTKKAPKPLTQAQALAPTKGRSTKWTITV